MKKGVMNKQGQFYFLSAIVIISVLVGFSGLSNYATRGEAIRVYDIGEELGIESANVLDYGTYPANNVILDDFLFGFAENYSDYIGADKEILFVVGNPEDGTIIIYDLEEVDTGGAEINVGQDSSSGYSSKEKKLKKSDPIIFTAGETNVEEVTLGDQTYNIELNYGENFYFVITQEIGDEVFIFEGLQ